MCDYVQSHRLKLILSMYPNFPCHVHLGKYLGLYHKYLEIVP